MRKIMMTMVCAGMVFTMAGCRAQSKTVTDQTPAVMTDTKKEIVSDDQTQIPNPFIECESLEDAEKLAGFSVELPDSLSGYQRRVISAVEDDMIQVDYTNEEDTVQSEEELNQKDWSQEDFTNKDVTIRKAKENGDISGDYNTYSEQKEVTVGDSSVTMKGNEGMISVAIWQDGEYSYAVITGIAVSEETMSEWIKQVK